MRLVPLEEAPESLPGPLLPCEDRENMLSMNQAAGSHQTPTLLDTLDLRLPASRTARAKCLLFKLLSLRYFVTVT